MSALSVSQLHALAITLHEGEVPDVSETTELELFDYIITYVKSEKLRGLEDEGMSCLLHLQDQIKELSHGSDDTQASITPVEVTSATVIGSQVTDDMATVDTVSKGTDTATPSVSEQVSGLLRITDVAALLPRREFKIHGGQISEGGSEITYSSICKQMDEGLRERFTETEVIRTVLKVIKPGPFRDMLTNKYDLTVDELKRFLRSHLRDKSSTELFQELSNTRQQDKETAQQFVYRIMGLKQRVLFASQQSGAELSYDKKLVQGVFLHTLYQGLNEKNSNIRHDIKPYISDLQVTDDFILEQITKSASEESERLKRLGPSTRPKPVTISSAQQGDSERSEKFQPTPDDSEAQANRIAIMELTAHLSALTQKVEKLLKPTVGEAQGGASPLAANSATERTNTKGKCHECSQQGNANCPHCFRCGQAGHRAIGCLKKQRSGNGVRSLERDGQ